jgi:hypothetical protein
MLDGYVFAVGGWEGRSRLDSVECYNPHTNTWQFMESVKMAVTSPAVVALDGLLYVTGRRDHCSPTSRELYGCVYTGSPILIFF